MQRIKEVLLVTSAVTSSAYVLTQIKNFQYVITGFILASFSVDFYSGILHWALDSYGCKDTPMIGGLIQPFRDHHKKPLAMLKHDFISTNANSCYIILIQSAAFSALRIEHGLVLWYWFFSSIFALICNETHKWSHQKNPHRLVKCLQKCGIFLSFTEHHKHHTNHTTAYCMYNGWMNPILDTIRFWRGMENAIEAITGVPPFRD